MDCPVWILQFRKSWSVLFLFIETGRLSSAICRLCHGKFSPRSLRHAFNKWPQESMDIVDNESDSVAQSPLLFHTDFQRLVGVQLDRDPRLSEFVCKKCHTKFYKCHSILIRFLQRVNLPLVGKDNLKMKWVKGSLLALFSNLELLWNWQLFAQKMYKYLQFFFLLRKNTKSPESSINNSTTSTLNLFSYLKTHITWLAHSETFSFFSVSITLVFLRPQVPPQPCVMGSPPWRGLQILSWPQGGAGEPMLGLRQGYVVLHRWSQLYHGYPVH